MGERRHSLLGWLLDRVSSRLLGRPSTFERVLAERCYALHDASLAQGRRIEELERRIEELEGRIEELEAQTREVAPESIPAKLEVDGWTATLTTPAELGNGPWCVLAVRKDRPADEPTYGIYVHDPASGEAALVTGCSTTGQTVIVEPAFYHLYLPDETEAPMPDPDGLVIAWGWRFGVKISQAEAEEIASSLEDGSPVRHDDLVFLWPVGGTICALSREARA